MGLKIEHLNKSFPYKKKEGAQLVLQDVNFDLLEGETVVLMGANGCGKSTLFRIIAGLEDCSGGRIMYPGNCEISVELMFQDFRSTLFPWLTAERNALGQPKSDPREQKLARELLASFIPDLNRTAYLSELSGGEQQVIALIRALSRSTLILLLDEPFTSLDMAMRQQAYFACRDAIKLKRIQNLLIATHNIEDAVTLADRVIILSNKPSRVFLEIRISQYKVQSQDGFFGTMIEEVQRRLRDAAKADKNI